MSENSEWNPEKRELSVASLDEFLQHQIIYHESLQAARKGTPNERSDDYKATRALISELRHLRFKVKKIFVDELPTIANMPKVKKKEFVSA